MLLKTLKHLSTLLLHYSCTAAASSKDVNVGSSDAFSMDSNQLQQVAQVLEQQVTKVCFLILLSFNCRHLEKGCEVNSNQLQQVAQVLEQQVAKTCCMVNHGSACHDRLLVTLTMTVPRVLESMGSGTCSRLTQLGTASQIKP